MSVQVPSSWGELKTRHFDERLYPVISMSVYIPSFRGAKRREIFLFRRYCERFLPSVEMTVMGGRTNAAMDGLTDGKGRLD
jgi:hypothetical protein